MQLPESEAFGVTKILHDYRRRVEQERKISAGVEFLSALAILLKFRNAERAFVEAAREIGSRSGAEEIKKTSAKVYGGVLTAEQALEELASAYESLSPALAESFRMVRNELRSPRRALDEVFRESMELIKKERLRALDRYEARFRMASLVMSFSPVACFLVLPIFLGMLEINSTFGFALGALLFPALFALGILAVARTKISLPPLHAVLPALLFPLVLITAAVYARFAREGVVLRRVVEAREKALSRLISRLHDAEVEIRRGAPVKALPISRSEASGDEASGAQDSSSIPKGLTSVSFADAQETIASLVERVFGEVVLFGKRSAEVLHTLREYVTAVIDYRRSVDTRLEASRFNLRALHFLTPAMLATSLWGFKFLAKNLKELQGYQAGLLAGLHISEPNLPLVFGLINAGYAFSAWLLSYAAAEREELAKAELGRAAAGVFLLLAVELWLLV